VCVSLQGVVCSHNASRPLTSITMGIYICLHAKSEYTYLRNTHVYTYILVYMCIPAVNRSKAECGLTVGTGNLEIPARGKAQRDSELRASVPR